MAMIRSANFSFSGPASNMTFTQLRALPCFRDVPKSLMKDADSPMPTADWAERWLPETKIRLSAGWDRLLNRRLNYKLDLVVASFPFKRSVHAAIELFVGLEFELASFDSLHRKAWRKLDVELFGFGGGHTSLGPMCAFRGAGHDRLVSRRWLDHGPWRVIRRPGDLTIVQFHDLHADAETALAQAASGHKRMGIDDEGGFIQKRYVYTHDLKGLYNAETKTYKIIVHSRDISACEMLDAAALRHYRKDDPEEPIETMAYVFAVPEVAHAHLHELWLRDIEVWTFDPNTGKEVRLDDTYEPPPPTKPEWVLRLENEGQTR